MAWRCLNNLASTYLCDKFRKRSTIYSLATRKRDNHEIQEVYFLIWPIREYVAEEGMGFHPKQGV